jgi:hypothetical protein
MPESARIVHADPRTPQAIQAMRSTLPHGSCLLWIDRETQLLGLMSTHVDEIVLPLAEIERFTLTVLTPAKGGGGIFLTARGHGRGGQDLAAQGGMFTSVRFDSAALPWFQEVVRQLRELGLPVDTPPPQPDC